VIGTDQGTALRHAYDIEGYVVVRQVLDADLVAQAGRHVDWLLARHPDLRGEDLGTDLVADDPFWLRLVSDDRLLDLAEAFVGPDLALFASHYLAKPARSGRAVLWHQDAAYWPLEPMEVISLWLAVDPSTTENGCMRVVPRSHRGEVHGLRDRDDVANVLGSESSVAVDESTAVDIVLAPGDVAIHHPNLMHGSGPNRSGVRRCGLTIRYIPTTTRILTDGEPFPSAFHLRGQPGDNLYQPWPTFMSRG
jgi:phytanoyl-CoA hydroxylase